MRVPGRADCLPGRCRFREVWRREAARLGSDSLCHLLPHRSVPVVGADEGVGDLVENGLPDLLFSAEQCEGFRQGDLPVGEVCLSGAAPRMVPSEPPVEPVLIEQCEGEAVGGGKFHTPIPSRLNRGREEAVMAYL